MSRPGAIVVDCSAAVEALRGDDSARATLGSAHLFAPHLIDAEVAHTIRGWARGGHVTSAQGARMVGRWAGMGVARFAMHPLLSRVWELRENLSAYDAIYVALAEELDCPLITADARLAAAPGRRCEVTVV